MSEMLFSPCSCPVSLFSVLFMEQSSTRRQAAELLPVRAVSPARQVVGGVFLMVPGAGVALFLLAASLRL